MTDLDGLEALEKAATPGPWEAVPSKQEFHGGGREECDGIWANSGERIVETDLGCYPPVMKDAALIVALRNAAPALFQELRELRA